MRVTQLSGNRDLIDLFISQMYWVILHILFIQILFIFAFKFFDLKKMDDSSHSCLFVKTILDIVKGMIRK